MKFKKIAIIGVGLIGGSIGMAIRKNKLASEVMGIGRSPERLKMALKLKAIDTWTMDIKEGVRDADIFVIATPVKQIPIIFKRALPFLKKGCIVTDTGSTKGEIVKEIEKILPKNINFIGAHPIAGSELQSVRNAKKELFKDAFCVLTPIQKTNKSILGIIEHIWRKCGAEVIILSPDEHDKILSMTSHLPHMTAVLLMWVFSGFTASGKKLKSFMGGGFRDTTRIAASSAEIWTDIFDTNRKEILKRLAEFKVKITLMQKVIRRRDLNELNRILRYAKEERDSL